MFNIQGYNDFKLAYIREFDKMQNELSKDIYNGFKVPTNMTEALQLALDLSKENEVLKIENEEMKPTVDFVNKTFEPREGSIMIREFANMIYDKDSLDIGEKKLYNFLRTKKMVTKNNRPMQKYTELDIFELKNSKTSKRLVTYVTNKGQTTSFNMQRSGICI